MDTNKNSSTKSKQTYIETVGRRREATARVRLYTMLRKQEVTVRDQQLKKGDIVVNHLPAATYFPGQLNEKIYSAPLLATAVDNVAVVVQVTGGGKNGQLEAMVHALSRALDQLNHDSYHAALKKRGFLTRDPRKKERRKAGLAGKARKKKSSPKR